MGKWNIMAERRGMTRRTVLIITVLTALLVAFVLFSNYGLLTRISLNAEGSTLHDEIMVLKSTEDSLRTVIKSLENDSLEIERLARERYGYVKQGEQVYIIDAGTK